MPSAIRNHQEINMFVSGESVAASYMDLYYTSLGFEILQRGESTKYDVLLKRDDSEIKIEEKYRPEDYGDFLVELLQDVTTNWSGWYYTENPDYLNYVITDRDWKPKEFYRVDFDEFKNWFPEYLSQTKTPKVVLSKRGLGLTLNVAVSWKSIPETIWRKFVIRTP